MYNLIILGNLSHIIAPKYCNVGASLVTMYVTFVCHPWAWLRVLSVTLELHSPTILFIIISGYMYEMFRTIVLPYRLAGAVDKCLAGAVDNVADSVSVVVSCISP